jgi:DNA-binding NarL/FixJ family response regulator
MISVFILDDHRVVINGLQHVLESDPTFQVVGWAVSVRDTRAMLPKLRPNVLLMDLRVPDSRGLEEIQEFKALSPGTRVLVITGYAGGTRDDALRAGADGFLSKGVAPEEITSEIRKLCPHGARQPHAGNLLSERERQVWQMVAEGLSNQEIADRMCVTLHTVKTHVSRILSKLQLRDRVSLAIHWRKMHHNE